MLPVRNMQEMWYKHWFSFLDHRCYRDRCSSCRSRSHRHCYLSLLLGCLGIKHTCCRYSTKPRHISHRCSKLPNAVFRASIYTESSIWQPTSKLSSTRTTITSLQYSLLIINAKLHVLSLTFIIIVIFQDYLVIFSLSPYCLLLWFSLIQYIQ